MNGYHFCRAVRLALGPLLLCVLLGAGCGTHQSQTNRLRVSLEVSPTTFDPAMVEDVATTSLLAQMYEGLVQWSAHNTLVPCLAEKWDISRDGLTYTFHLRKGVRFQNGLPLTAGDVAFSFRRALDPQLQSPVAPLYLKDIAGALDVFNKKAKDVSGIRVLDPLTLSIRLISPKAYWLNTLTYPTADVLCKAVVEKTGVRPLTADDAAQGIATGPFKITRYVKDSEVDMDSNRAYWDGAPPIAGQVQKVVLNPGTRHNLFASGDLDIATEIQIGNLNADRSDPQLRDKIKVWPRAAIYYLALNQRAYAPFHDVRVRQAFAYATDKEKIRHIVNQDVFAVAPSILPAGIGGHDPNLQGIPLDLGKARQLLAQAGYPGGKGMPPLNIIYNESRPTSQKTVDLLRQMYSELGVTVVGQPMEWSTMLHQTDKNVLPAFHLSWYADYLDPQDFLSLLLVSTSPQNHSGYHNPQFDSLCNRADIERDPAKRTALYEQAGRIAASEVPLVPLYFSSTIELVSPRIHGLEDCLLTHLPYKKVSLQ